MTPFEQAHTDQMTALRKQQADADALLVARQRATTALGKMCVSELNAIGVPTIPVPAAASNKPALAECIDRLEAMKTPILKGDVSSVVDKLKGIRDIIPILLLCVLSAFSAHAEVQEAEKDFQWKIGHVGVATLNERGFNEVNPAFYRLTEKFLQCPALKAVNELPGSDSTSPTATALLAYTIANKNFSVIGTNMTTALCTFCTGTGLVPSGGITLNTAGADADQAILLPSLTTGLTQWSNGAWRTDRRTRFESWIRTGGKPAAISNSALTSNVVTITTSTNHNLSIGQSVTVAMLTGPALFADMNGTYTVATIPSTTTFTYALTHANISTGASTGTLTTNNLLLQTIWTGLKLTNTGVIATDDDQFYARYRSTENGGQWQVITSRANVDTTSVIPVTVTPNTLYRFRFTVDANLCPLFVLNGQTYDLGAAGNAALVTGKSFIPYTGTSANGTTPGTKAIDVLEETISAIE